MGSFQFKKWIVVALGVLCVFAHPSHAHSLAEMEAIAARFPTLNAFLDDAGAVREYREALKSYMGESADFDPVYTEFIRQISEVNSQVKTFGEKAWRANPHWLEERFSIVGSATGSGLETHREAVMAAVDEFRKELRADAGDLLGAGELTPNETRIAELVQELKDTYQIESTEILKRFSVAQRKAYNRRLGGDLKRGIPRIALHPAAIQLSAFLTHWEIEHNETVSDPLLSGDADLIAMALKALKEPVGFRTAADFKSPYLREYLGYFPPAGEKILRHFSDGLKSAKEFRAIANPILDAEARQGRQSPENRAAFERYELWQRQNALVQNQKREFARRQKEQNPYFYYDLHHDVARDTLSLKNDSSTSLSFVPAPRPFHAFFAGRKNMECVGGRDCANLVVKRWIRGALDGSQNLFTETDEGRMEGMVGLTKLINQRTGRSYHVVDLMSVKIKSTILFTDAQNRQIKYSIFDRLVDEYQPRLDSDGLIISDGNNVSQNVRGAEVVEVSPAYLENQIVGEPNEFAPADPMAVEVSGKFPQTLNGYGKGGLIYDGMKGDGTKVVRLVPSGERRTWTKTELETDIFIRLLSDQIISDGDVLWKRAKESGVALPSLIYYRSQIEKNAPESEAILRRYFIRPLLNLGSAQAIVAGVDLLAAVRRYPSTHPVVAEIADDLLSRVAANPGTSHKRPRESEIIAAAAKSSPRYYLDKMRLQIIDEGINSPLAFLFSDVLGEQLKTEFGQDYAAEILSNNVQNVTGELVGRSIWVNLGEALNNASRKGSPVAPLSPRLVASLEKTIEKGNETNRNIAAGFLIAAFSHHPPVLPLTDFLKGYFRERMITGLSLPDDWGLLAAAAAMELYPGQLLTPEIYDLWLSKFSERPELIKKLLQSALRSNAGNHSFISPLFIKAVRKGINHRHSIAYADAVLETALVTHPNSAKLQAFVKSLMAPRDLLYGSAARATERRVNARHVVLRAFLSAPSSQKLQRFLWELLSDRGTRKSLYLDAAKEVHDQREFQKALQTLSENTDEDDIFSSVKSFLDRVGKALNQKFKSDCRIRIAGLGPKRKVWPRR